MVTASVGGPIAPGKSPVLLIPYVTAGVQHGVSENITVHGNAHLLMAAFGVVGMDVGASLRALRQNGAVPEVTVGATAIVFSTLYSLNNTRIYPDLHVACSWIVNTDWLMYVGAHNTVQSDRRYFFSPLVGLQFPISSKMSLKTEFMMQAVNQNTSSGTLEGISSISKNGSAGFFVGAQWQL